MKKLIITTCAVIALCCTTTIFAQVQGTVGAKALILTDEFGHKVKVIPSVSAAPGDYIYEIPLVPINLEGSTGSSIGASSGEAQLANRFHSSQNPQTAADPEPYITYTTGSTNLTNNRVAAAGSGISLSIGGSDNTGFTISNSGVLSNVAGNGISVNNGGTGNVTITNTGVTSAVAGSGIGLSGGTGAVTISNTGVTSVAAGSGVTVSGSTGGVTIGTTGLASNTETYLTLTNTAGLANERRLAAGTGVSMVDGGAGSTLTVNNTGVLSNVAGSGISVSGGTGNVTIANTGVTSAVAGAGIGVSGGTGAVTFSNTGVTSVIAGTGISVNAATGGVTINNTGVTSVGVSMPNIFAVVSSPVTTTGTIGVTMVNQAEHTFLAGPISGNGTPAFRAIDASDIAPIVWTLDGNDITEGQFLGGKTGNAYPLELRVDGLTMLQLNDNSSIQRDEGGNFRPPYAVDMQIARQSDDQVAGGWYSTVSGGRANKASAAGSTVGGGGYDNDVIAGNIASGIATTIAGGHGNEANNFYSAIGGGDFNSASGFANSIAGGEFNITSDYGCVVSGGIQNTSGSEATFIGGGTQNSAYNTKSVIGGGNLNTTNGAFSAIVGGESNTANADYSFIGASNQAMTDKYGQAAHAAGSFANAGDAQASEYVARTTTSDGSWTEVFLDGNSARMNIANNTAWTFVAQVTGLSSGGDVGSYEIKGAIKNNGTVSIVGTVSVTTIAEDNAAWDVKAEADNGNSSLKISVKGSLATDMRWVVSVRTTEVKY